MQLTDDCKVWCHGNNNPGEVLKSKKKYKTRNNCQRRTWLDDGLENWTISLFLCSLPIPRPHPHACSLYINTKSSQFLFLFHSYTYFSLLLNSYVIYLHEYIFILYATSHRMRVRKSQTLKKGHRLWLTNYSSKKKNRKYPTQKK